MTQISKAVDGARQAAIAGLTDAELLSCFLDRRDEAAFAALVHRHGPMVWSVCRRLLDHHQAEDACQAVFLVLFRRAAAIRPRSMVANWLYGVAHQTTLHVRRTTARRRMRERQVPMPEPAAKETDAQFELRGVLDAELSRLPDKYRAVVILCDIEGRTRTEASRQLGCPEGTVAGHLARGRAMLARRLRRHGLGVSGGALVAVLAKEASAMPTSVLSSTVATVVNQTIPARVVALAEGVIKTMMLTKLKVALPVVLALGLMATGAVMVTSRTSGQDGQNPAADKSVEPAAKQDKDKDAVTAWGKQVGGLQAGLGFPAGEHRAYHTGETVKLVVRVRNVSKEIVTFKYLRQFFIETAPTVTDGKGEPVPLPHITALGRHIPVQSKLAPGKEIELYELELKLRPASERGNNFGIGVPRPSTLYGAGTFGIQYDRTGGPSSGNPAFQDPILSKLATGKLELQVQDAEDTAWGTPAGGLQASLTVRPKRPIYHYGEVIRVNLSIRNVSKDVVKFEYLRQFFDENPPTVIDADGKTVPQQKARVEGFHVPVKVSLAPGEVIYLQSRLQKTQMSYVLKPADLGGTPTASKLSPLFVGPGKVTLQYKQVFGDSSSGQINLDPVLSKLATGKVELQVQAAEKKPESPAWGKQAGGLQAGLAIRPGKRVYHHGETITLRW